MHTELLAALHRPPAWRWLVRGWSWPVLLAHNLAAARLSPAHAVILEEEISYRHVSCSRGACGGWYE